MKWNRRYLRLAERIASWSKDPSTKVGAIIVAPGNRPIGFGFNGFARHSDDGTSLYVDKEYKHRHIIHAETNAILNAKAAVDGCSIYITHPPCPHCAGIIVQAGITYVYYIKPDKQFASRWNLNDSLHVLKSAGIIVRSITMEKRHA